MSGVELQLRVTELSNVSLEQSDNFDWYHYRQYLTDSNTIFINFGAIILLTGSIILGQKVISKLSDRNFKIFNNNTMSNWEAMGTALFALGFGLGGMLILSNTCQRAVEAGRTQLQV